MLARTYPLLMNPSCSVPNWDKEMEDSFTMPCHTEHKKKRFRDTLAGFGLIAVLSGIWLALRSGSKPSRLVYPCQQVALSNIEVFKAMLLSAFPSAVSFLSSKKIRTVILIGGIVLASTLVTTELAQLNFFMDEPDNYTRVPINLIGNTATIENPSNLYYVKNASGEAGSMDLAVSSLLTMLASNNESFYDIIGSDDVVVLKVNCQWDSRGGTNTDLLKSVIQAILDHPDGFTGEIVVCDNGQGLGSFEYMEANAFNHSQNIQSVVDSFSSHKVSTYLWDNIRTNVVNDYNQGDSTDGYVLSDTFLPETHMYVSYPKFQTDYGTNISLKLGIFNGTQYNSDQLMIINMPVLKSHGRYGVTGCVKNYMGVPMGEIISSINPTIPHEHFSIGLGGMGSLMGEVRAPVLNILDMIWTNPNPMESSAQRGPSTSYSGAKFTDAIAASRDPVALDYWSSKNVLCAAAEYLNYTEYASLDPDYAPRSIPVLPGYPPMDESFHNYLNRTIYVLSDYGIHTTMNPEAMNVFVTELANTSVTNTGTSTTTQPTDINGLDLALMIAVPAISAVLILCAILFLRRKED
jgi:hypothetical protein